MQLFFQEKLHSFSIKSLLLASGALLRYTEYNWRCVLMNDMATFEEAQIDDGYLAEIRAMR